MVSGNQSLNRSRVVHVKNLYYLHGLKSSPDGFRACYIRERYPELVAPALSEDVYERMELLEREIQAPVYLVGSSLGGLSALMFVEQFPQLVKGMMLLAPAVGFCDQQYRTPEILALVERLIIPAGIPTAVIAATRDEVIPCRAIQTMVARSPKPEDIMLNLVDDIHRCREQATLDCMMQGIQHILA